MRMKWGGSGIEKCLFDFVCGVIPRNSTVVELGSGQCSTTAFSSLYDLYSVEDNKKYVGKYASKYIYAQLVDGWYDTSVLAERLPKKQAMVFVDGPKGSGCRDGIAKNMFLFDSQAVFIFHDTNRQPERQLAINVAGILGRNIEFFEDGDNWAIIRGQ